MKTKTICLIGIFLLVTFGTALAVEIGQELPDLNLNDAENQPCKITDYGKKVISIIYADPEAADVNDPYSDALKAKDFSKATFKGMGIANLKDTWLPNAAIRMMIRKKIEKYDATILTDKDRTLPTQWKLGDCNDQSVVIIIGKDKKVKFFKKGPLSQAEITKALDTIAALL